MLASIAIACSLPRLDFAPEVVEFGCYILFLFLDRDASLGGTVAVFWPICCLDVP